MSKKKIYMAGVGGMLGEAFQEVFGSEYEIECSDLVNSGTELLELDFRDRAAYFSAVKRFSPDYLFHIGAHTNLEFCEMNADNAYQTNTIAVETAVNIANSLNIPLLYISTAGIFDGEKELYDDWDQPNPLGVYARSKYLGERYVVENCDRYLVCRAGWMMGGGPSKDKKFVQKIMNQIKNGATNLNIVNDKDGTPTYTYDFANNVKTLLNQEVWGLYNLVCGGQTSRVEVCEYLLKLLNREDIKISEVESAFFNTEYFAPRPPCERLENKRLNLMGMNQMTDWKEALSRYIDSAYRGYLDD